MDNTVVDISKGHIEMDNEPFDFRLLFKNPETSKYIDAVAKGKIDLANIQNFVKLEGNTKLGGLVSADVFAKGNLSAIQQQQGPFTAGGFPGYKRPVLFIKRFSATDTEWEYENSISEQWRHRG
ncbi:MAG: hypothetical protein WDO19_25645 [Bacteroidota bacterium]